MVLSTAIGMYGVGRGVVRIVGIIVRRRNSPPVTIGINVRWAVRPTKTDAKSPSISVPVARVAPIPAMPAVVISAPHGMICPSVAKYVGMASVDS
jgi:hypothetical protein